MPVGWLPGGQYLSPLRLLPEYQHDPFYQHLVGQSEYEATRPYFEIPEDVLRRESMAVLAARARAKLQSVSRRVAEIIQSLQMAGYPVTHETVEAVQSALMRQFMNELLAEQEEAPDVARRQFFGVPQTPSPYAQLLARELFPQFYGG